MDLILAEDPLKEGRATHSVFLPGKPHGQRRLVGYGPCGHKDLDTTETTEHAHTYQLSMLDLQTGFSTVLISQLWIYMY